MDMIGEAMLQDDFVKVPVAKEILNMFAPLVEKFSPYESFREFSVSNNEFEAINILPSAGQLKLQDLAVTPTTFESQINWCVMDWTGNRRDYAFPKPARGHLNALERQYEVSMGTAANGLKGVTANDR
jgi:hypothetical protein